MDYTDTIAPISKYNSVRAILGLAVAYDPEIHHMDVITPFLHGELSEAIYMHQDMDIRAGGDESVIGANGESIGGGFVRLSKNPSGA